MRQTISPRVRSKHIGKTNQSSSGTKSHSVVAPLMMILVFALISVAEYTSHFAEKSAGAYLNWRNADRDAWGTLWVKEASKRNAARQLDAETAEATRLRRKAELVNSFAELVPIMPSGVGVPITPAKFIELYRNIPTALQNNLLPPDELAKMYWSNKIRRASAWVDNGNLVIYLIDDRNRVIRDVAIDESTLKAVENYGRIASGRIENMSIFTEFSMSAETFFQRYYALNTSEQELLFDDANALLAIAKPVTKVGMGLNENDRFGVLGFESIGADGYYVITFPVFRKSLGEFVTSVNSSEEIQEVQNSDLAPVDGEQ